MCKIERRREREETERERERERERVFVCGSAGGVFLQRPTPLDKTLSERRGDSEGGRETEE